MSALDREVAEKVLGWVKGMNFFGHEAWFRGDELVADAETWTADSAEGMLAVIEAMCADDSDELTMTRCESGEWHVGLYVCRGNGWVGGNATDASLPRAVALAALAAIGGAE